MKNHKRWSEVGELGFLSGMRFLFWVYRIGGHFAFKIVLQPALLYYFLSNRVARKSSLEFLHRVKQFTADDTMPEANWWNAYRHFNAFAVCSLDRLGAWANTKVLERVTFDTHPVLLDQLDSGRGAVLLGAHLGNMEILRSMSTKNPKIKLNILVHTHNADMFNRLLREVVGDSSVTLIEVSELSPATAIHLNDCIERGEFVAILADRVPISSVGRSREISFLGKDARFPDGPFILASLLKCPVYSVFCTRDGDGYDIRCQKLADRVKLPRRDRDRALTEYMKLYVEVLEGNVRRYPLQWFNFYPFWN